MIDMRTPEEHMLTSSNVYSRPTEQWVHEALEPDQLSTAKQRFGRRKLSRSTILLLWGLRAYVLLMSLLIAFQIWNALHAGG
jgi:hypothetical protein